MSNYVHQDVPVGAFVTEVAAYSGQLQRLLLLDSPGDGQGAADLGGEDAAAVVAAHVAAARAEAVVHALRVQDFCRAYPAWLNSQIAGAFAADDSDPASREVLESFLGTDESAYAERMTAALERVTHPIADHSQYCEDLATDITLLFLMCHGPLGSLACMYMALAMTQYATHCMHSA